MLSDSNLSAFTASGRGLLRLLRVDLSAITRSLAVDLSALISLQALFFVIVDVIQNKSLEHWHAIIIVVRQISSALAFVVLKDLKIFYPDGLILLFDVYLINCVTIVADQDALWNPWCSLLQLSCLLLFV